MVCFWFGRFQNQTRNRTKPASQSGATTEESQSQHAVEMREVVQATSRRRILSRPCKALQIFLALVAVGLFLYTWEGASSKSAIAPASRVSGARPKLVRGSQGCIGGADWFTVRRKTLGFTREPLLDMSPAQRAANSRVLLISSDTRLLRRSWENRSYASLSMILNRQYAYTHGYDFAFVRTCHSSQPPGLYSEERDAACFHPYFKLWRVHNWCKVLILWAAATATEEVEGGGTRPLYDLVVYLEDGDVVTAGIFSEVRSRVPGLHRQAGLMGLTGGPRSN